jgi:hypothetical protein
LVIKNNDYFLQRSQLLSYLKTLRDRFKLTKAIYYLAVYFMDQILSQNTRLLEEYIALGCLILASKNNLTIAKLTGNVKIPKYHDISLFIKNVYNVKELAKAELLCLTLLDYKTTNCSALLCLDYFLSVGVIWESENFDTELLSDFYSLCYKVLDFFIDDVRFVDFNPVQVACAVIALCRDYYKLKEPWSSLSAKAFDTSLNDFMNCFIVIKR